MVYRCLIALLALPAALPAQPAAPTANPFAGFETRYLENGLKVWYKRLPGDPLVSISVALPFGSDMDPPGKEQLAHFTEHMLFSDQPGRSEEEIRDEIESLGGVYNASVTADRTFYYVHIGREDVAFAIEWLSRIVGPHAMHPEIVERQREPVALEIGARPRQLFDWIWARYLYPPALRTPGFWEREFGIETWSSRDYYPYASLYGITADDLRAFYDRYYAPSAMTLTIVGDVGRDTVFASVQQAFSVLPARPAPGPARELLDPNRYWQRILWDYRSNVYYSNRFKFYELSPDQEVMLLFVAQLLAKRLNDQLRFGERKATYGIGVSVVKRAGAAYLHVRGGLKKEEFDFARGVVEGEIEALRSGTMSVDEYEVDRAAVVNQLRVNDNSPEELESWIRNFFYEPDRHRDFPDLVTAFESYSLADIQEFMRAGFVPERQYIAILKPHPLSQGVMLGLVVILVWLTVYALRKVLVRPVEMTRIRYVARFKLPRLYLVALVLVFLIAAAVGARLLAYVFQLLVEGYLVRLSSFPLQYSAYALMLVVSISLVIFTLAGVPRKLLLFDDELRLKYLSYRSRSIPLDTIEEVSLRRFRTVWLSRRLWRCAPLAIGLLSPAIYLRLRGGRSIYFRTRDTEEALVLLDEARRGALQEAAQSTR
jgi:predicted Zn-dependent peptidase